MMGRVNRDKVKCSIRSVSTRLCQRIIGSGRSQLSWICPGSTPRSRPGRRGGKRLQDSSEAALQPVR